MATETRELQPGPIRHMHAANQPFGNEFTESLNVAFRGRALETRSSYGVPQRRLTWQIGKSSYGGPRVQTVHILPKENKVIYEGDLPSYPLPPTGHSTSGCLLFERLVVEEQSGTLSIQFSAEEHGKKVSQILDINRSGQLHFHPSMELPTIPPAAQHYTEEDLMP